MLVHLAGRGRTDAEYGALFELVSWTHFETYVAPEGPANVLEVPKA